MIYSDLIVPVNNWKYIKQTGKNNRLPHALLLHGPQGSGKEGFALEVTALMNCKQPSHENGACGLCSSCIKVKGFQHPNVSVIHPMTPAAGNVNRDGGLFHTLAGTPLRQFREMLEKKGKDPYAGIELKASSIPVQIIRECRKDLYMSAVESGWRILLIFKAELLCSGGKASANALLKILEEPPENTLFILITSQKEALLDTIQSRCHALYFSAVNNYSMERLLEKRNLPAERIPLLSKICSGDIQTALFLNDNYDSIKMDCKIIFNALFSETPANWRTYQTRIMEMNRSGLTSMFNTFFFLQVAILKDLLLIQKMEKSPELTFSSFKNNYSKIIFDYPDADFHACIDIIESAMILNDSNVNQSLISLNILLDIRNALNGKEVKPIWENDYDYA